MLIQAYHACHMTISTIRVYLIEK